MTCPTCNGPTKNIDYDIQQCQNCGSLWSNYAANTGRTSKGLQLEKGKTMKNRSYMLILGVFLLFAAVYELLTGNPNNIEMVISFLVGFIGVVLIGKSIL
jgi:hypothetical protein